MARTHSVFACQNCGCQSPKWMGRCPECGQWNSLVEERVGLAEESAAGPPPGTPASITATPMESADRLPTGIGELDRLLGGGVVPGSLVLLGGDPGIGKSTLVLQVLSHLARNSDVLYAGGEESPQQIRMRAERLGALQPRLMLLTETDAAVIAATAERHRPALLVVDSVQTLSLPGLSGAPGTVGQVREGAARMMALAKSSRIPVVLIGHITKEGTLAGPKMLEHLVDTVLYFEGDRGQDERLLRTIKNRFGPSGELALFRMTERGLEAVSNPSAWLLAGRPTGVSGSAVTVALEGTRPMAVEIQALVSPTAVPGVMPRRVCSGIDPARLHLILAVLEKRTGLPFSSTDVFVKVSGGLRIDEPAADLALAAAAVSSAVDRPLEPLDCFLGEVGLAGEIRPVGRLEARIEEAVRLGFRRVWTAPRREASSAGKGGKSEGFLADGVEPSEQIETLVARIRGR